MCSPADSASFLQMMVKLTGAKKVVEVGVFTGFSTLAFALALPDDGVVHALDLNKDFASVGEPFWAEAKMDVSGTITRIEIRSVSTAWALCLPALISPASPLPHASPAVEDQAHHRSRGRLPHQDRAGGGQFALVTLG